ncbi:MAG: ferrous iron transport protein B [Nitrososphaeria archaeon]
MAHGALRVAVAGIPNCGKSTLVSALSGLSIRTANYPGTTVSIQEIRIKEGGREIILVDLPGTYGLRSDMADEAVAAREILSGNYDVLLVVGSAMSPEQTMYLLLQVLELGRPTVLVLNMMDVAGRRGVALDAAALEKRLGIRVLPISAATGMGIGELRGLLSDPRAIPRGNEAAVDYGPLEKYIDEAARALRSSRGIAIAALTGALRLPEFEAVEEIARRARSEVGSPGEFIAGKRWRAVRELVAAAFPGARRTPLGRLDSALLNAGFGPIVSLIVRFALAESIFMALGPAVDYISEALGWIPVGAAASRLGNALAESLIVDGIWNGLTTLISFIPYVFGVALLVALIEDSGLIVRLVLPLERWLRALGVPSRGLIYMVAGAGCNIPAIAATGAIPSSRDRTLTALLIPYVPCTPRLLIISLIAAAVMPQLVGIAVALPFAVALIAVAISSRILGSTSRALGKPPPYAYELPPLVLPIHRAFLKKVWHYTYEFIGRAGVLIVAFVTIMWLLSVSGPAGIVGPEALGNPGLLRTTWLGIAGGLFSPLLNPIGIPWEISAALAYGYIFKEVVLGALVVLYGLGEGGLTHVLAGALSLPSALALMVFTTFYSPCVATIVAEARAAGWRLTAVNTVLQFLLATALTYSTYFIAGWFA